MDPWAQIDEARAVGRAVTEGGIDHIRGQALVQVRRSMGMTGAPPAPCADPAIAYVHPDSVVRRIHGDLPSMLIGGLSALLFQMLHPLAMAGVAQHSNYRADPLGRLERTAGFLGTTTFGTRDEARDAIERVRRIHSGVRGTAADGRPYSAGDPGLLTWVHAAEVSSFLAATRVYAPVRPTAAEEDDYLAQMARVALALGAADVPRSRADLDAYFVEVRPRLRMTPDARTARNFVLRGVGRWPHEIATYGLLVTAAQGVLPPWARRQLRLPALPAGDLLAVRPSARLLGSAFRWVVAQPVRPERA
ncbi:MAG: oxygenase MpaB family protein [Acidimicrobiales bacterium]|jgi:uncharacterized protein (DUF2236 family)